MTYDQRPRPGTIYDILEEGHTLYDLLDALISKAGFNEIETGLYHRLVEQARELSVFGTLANKEFKEE